VVRPASEQVRQQCPRRCGRDEQVGEKTNVIEDGWDRGAVRAVDRQARLLWSDQRVDAALRDQEHVIVVQGRNDGLA
jgi:hypothetical protein